MMRAFISSSADKGVAVGCVAVTGASREDLRRLPGTSGELVAVATGAAAAVS